MRSPGWLLLAFTVACGTPPPPLSNAHASPEMLAREILAALSRGDEARLRSLSLSEEEFRTHVWPSLPAARPERNLPFACVWGQLRQKSEAGIANVVARHGGRTYRFAGLSFEGPTSDYGTSRVHRRATFTVERPEGPLELRLCGSLFQKEGQWKVFSFVLDD